MNILSGSIALERLALLSGAQEAIMHSFLAAQTAQITNHKNPYEPAFVASFIFAGLPVLFGRWNPILQRHRIRLEIAGVFCHQCPYVTWGGIDQIEVPPKTKVELGDLLICHICDIPDWGLDHRRSSCSALLMQAKMGCSLAHHINSDELTQLHLYRKYPAFTYVSPKSLAGKARSIATWPGKPLQYLLINAGQDMWLARPQQPLVTGVNFEDALVRLLTVGVGRSFSYGTSDHWSLTVRDLLQVGLTKAFNLKAQGYNSQKRGQFLSGSVVVAPLLKQFDGQYLALTHADEVDKDAGVLRRISAFARLGEPPKEPIENRIIDEDEGSPSIIVIRTSRLEDQE